MSAPPQMNGQPPDQAQPPQQHQAGRLAEAEQSYCQVVARDPGNADALHLLGVVTHQKGFPDLAIDLIRRAIAINSRRPITAHLLP